MPRKPASDSIAGKTAAASRQNVTHLVPDGLTRLTKEQQSTWDKYTSARDTWKPHELATIHELCLLHTELKALRAEARITPHTYEKSNGDIAEHPVHKAEYRKRQEISRIEKEMGLHTPSSMAGRYLKEGQREAGSTRGKKKPQLSLLS